MADPVTITIDTNSIERVVENETAGVIKVISHPGVTLLETYRETGSPGPNLLEEFVEWKDALEFDSATPIDIYVYAHKQGFAGKVFLRRDV